MSVKLLYGVVNKNLCSDQEKLGGFCYCRLNPTGKSFGDKIYKDEKSISIDLSKYDPISKLTRENPIKLSLNFGIVPVESKTFRDVTIHNSKDLKTQISQSRVYVEPREELKEQFDKVFHILLPERTDILPALITNNNNQQQNRNYRDSQFKFRVLFKPKLAAIAYTTTLFVWVGNIPLKLKCHGFSEGPFVAFSQNVLNFGGQFYGSEASIRIDMINHSICDAHFQFDCDNFRSPFKICPMAGTIPASTTVKLVAVFRPHKPQTFYKRIYCLLHQQNPQYIDLLGVCIPRPFFVENPIDFCVSSVDTLFLPLPSPTFEEYFQTDCWGIKLSQDDFNFGAKNVNLTEESTMTFTLTSTLPYDVLVEWVQDPTQVFVISPQSTFLEARQSTTFQLSFCPQFPESFFGGQLECYIYPTTYVWPPKIGPPWVYAKKVKLQAAAHFQSRARISLKDEDNQKKEQEMLGLVREDAEEQIVEVVQDILDPTSFLSDMMIETEEEELGEFDEELWSLGGGDNNILAEKQQQQQNLDTISQNQSEQIIPGRINFQLQILNGKTSTSHSIPPKKHYHAISLYDVEPFSMTNLVCKKKEEAPLPKSAEIVTDKMDEAEEDQVLEEEEEVEEEEVKTEKVDEVQQQVVIPEKKMKKKKKKNDNESSKKGKRSKKKKEKEIKDGGKKKKRKKKNEEPELEILTDENEEEITIVGNNDESNTFEEEDFQNENELLMEEEDEQKQEVVDFLAMGDNNCSDHLLLKRGNSFTVPQSGVSDPSDPTELALPLCLIVRVAGHSYADSTQPPIPQFTIPSKVIMSPTLPQHRECRTIIMKNTSDLPILFDIKGFDRSEPYSAKPLIGLIPGEEKQILVLSMNTQSPHTAAYSHSCIVNLNVIDENQLSIFGYAEVPTMTITLLSDPTENVNEIVCPTTVPGYATFATMTMKNPSRFHYRFFLNCANEEPKSKPIFTPTPAEGIIAPYDSVNIVWKFVPYHYESYRVPWIFHFEVLGAKSDDSFWNAVYELSLPLTGQGDDCNLSVDPKILDFDLVQIFDSVSKTFTITNEGSTVLTANLVVLHEQWLQYYSKEQIQISPSQIHLGGGEKVDITVTVRADRPIMYRFYVQYELEKREKDPEGNLISESERNHLIDILFMGDHAIAQITHIQQIAKHPAWNVEEAWAMFSITELNILMTPLRHTAREGSLPNVPTVTFRFPAAPVGSPPTLFALTLTNLSDVTEYWQIYTQPPKHNKLYQLRHQSRQESFVGNVNALDSPSFLTALWTAKYAELDMTTELDITTGLSPQNSFSSQPKSSLTMAALKNGEKFRVTPNSGKIANRKTQQINFKFSYDARGEFRMPALLRVYPGIFVWLELQGLTLEPGQSALQLLYPKEMIFHPIGLSDLDPPIQFFWVYNGGIVSTSFEVDMDPFEKIKGENFGHGCIECLTPEGVALPKAWTGIKLRFAPLEFRNYVALLKIRSNGIWQTVELKGRTAVAEEVSLYPNPMISTSPQIFDPFVPIELTPPRAIFPHFIPTGTSTTTIIFITNLSSKHSMSFSWPKNTIVNSTSITFLPDIGILAPKEQCACQVIVKAGSVNQILSTTIRCWIEDVTAVNNFNRHDKLWKGEIVEYKKMMVVTKKRGPHQVHQAVSHHNQPNKPFSYSRLLGISCYIGSVFGTLDSMLVSEQTKMTFVDPIGIGVPGTTDGPMLPLSPFDRHLAKEVISQILWDMTLSPNWPSMIQQMMKRKSVYYDDYKLSELSTSKDDRDDTEFIAGAPQKLKADVLEFVMFTMLQEMADHYAASNEQWFSLKPGAPAKEML